MVATRVEGFRIERTADEILGREGGEPWRLMLSTWALLLSTICATATPPS